MRQPPFAAIVMLLAGLTAFAKATASRAEAPEARRRTTEIPVTLDVVVMDAKSQPVRDLKPSDFEVVDAGEPRAVESAHVQVSDSRVLGIFLDEYHVQRGESAARARTALTRFVNTMLREGDTVAVMKPLDRLNAITLTQDRAIILQTISTFEGRKGDYAAKSPFEEEFISRDPKTADRARTQVVTSALQALAAKLGNEAGGRTVLVLISEGFAPALPRTISYAANRHSVAIHTIDPHPDGTDNEAALRTLAVETGGGASVNESDLLPALTRAVGDLDAYYLVTYRAPANADGKFHPVEVRVKRNGTQARARSGYWAASPAPPLTSSSNGGTVMMPFRPAHTSPYIRPWIGMSRGPSGLTSVTVTWEPGAPPPRNQRVSSVTLKVTTPDGRILFENRVGPGDVSRATFDAPPGFVALEMAIQSSTGASLDTDYRGVAVPNLQVTRPTFATVQVLRTRNARAFAEASADPDAIPVASRTFSRAERLLVRIPVYGPGDTPPSVTATLHNRRGNLMRELQPVPADTLPAGVVQFDLPLSSLAPDEYRVELVAANPTGPKDETREVVAFRVTN
jgi:VWFA-related protein